MVLAREIKDYMFQIVKESGIPIDHFKIESRHDSLLTIHDDTGKFFEVTAIDSNNCEILFQRIYDDKNHGKPIPNTKRLGRVGFLNQTKKTIKRFLVSWLDEIKTELYTEDDFSKYFQNVKSDFKNQKFSEEEKISINATLDEIIKRLNQIESLQIEATLELIKTLEEIKTLIKEGKSKNLIWSTILGGLMIWIQKIPSSLKDSETFKDFIEFANHKLSDFLDFFQQMLEM